MRDGPMHYKRSRRGSADIDQVMEHVLERSEGEYAIRNFTPDGYDERQYCSPGFNLPVGVLSRTPHGRFAEYHTSADNLDFVDPAALADSIMKCLAAVEVLEGNDVYLSRNPKCEPQLGARGLYTTTDAAGDISAMQAAVLWVLNMSDGTHSLLDIARRSGVPFSVIQAAATTLVHHELLTESPAR